MQAYYKDRFLVTKEYDLSPAQRDNANYDEKKINAAIFEKTKEYEKQKKTVDLIHENQTHPITKNYRHFVKYWANYHAMEEDNPQSIAGKQGQGQRLIFKVNDALDNFEKEEKSDELLDGVCPPYFNAYKTALELSLEIMLLKQKLSDLDLCQLQANNYYEKLNKLGQSIRKANNHLTALRTRAKSAYFSSNPLTQAWNDCIDSEGYHKQAKRFETSLINLEEVVHALTPIAQKPIALQAARLKNINAYKSQCIIIETLTAAYDNIDLLSTDVEITTAENSATQKDMALKLQQLEQHCRQLSGSGSMGLQYIAGFCWILAAVVAVIAVTALSMYLSGGTAAALVVAVLTAAHIYPALMSIAAITGCSMALVIPLTLGIGGGLAVGTFGLFGAGFGRLGQDKNLLSRSTRQASALLLEAIPEARDFDSMGCQ